MVISKTDYRKDAKKFILALLIYTITITAFDYFTTDRFAPAHLQNDKEQGQNHQTQGEQVREYQLPIPVYPRPDSRQGDQNNEPSRGESLSSSRGREGRELIVEATSYSHTGRKTFSGTWPQEGVTIAVDNRKIKVGSRVYIQELNNWYLAEDLIPPESVRKGAIIDIFRNDIGHCRKWGRRDVWVKVIPPQNQTQKNN